MAAPSCSSAGEELAKLIVQYVVIRADLLSKLKWPIGAVITQACHASSAALYLFKDDPNTISYTSQLDSMHKVVLACPSEEALQNLADKLKNNQVDCKLWIEQPENIATALATKPYPKAEISAHFKQFKLYK